MRKLNFSQTNGLEPVPGPLGLGELPQSARNQIWTVFYIFLDENKESVHGYDYPKNILSEVTRHIFLRQHVNYFHCPIDEFNNDFHAWHKKTKNLIFQEEYNRVFDFIHAVINDRDCPEPLTEQLSYAFDEGQIAYRLLPIEKIIVPRISKEEDAAVDSALKETHDRFPGSNSHLKNAATHLRDNRPADSIRESIHAVESVMKILTDETSGDFSKALNKLTPVISLHSALKKGFDAIYGYTSDEKGIRHCLLDQPTNATRDDAIFMLSSCASMINYLINKNDSIKQKDAGCPPSTFALRASADRSRA